jgi:hypothetical protein
MTTPTTAELRERYGPPDDLAEVGSTTNDDRASWADLAVDAFGEACGLAAGAESLDEIVGDLIGDLLHLVTREGFDADEVLDSARRHFVAEVGLGYATEEAGR